MKTSTPFLGVLSIYGDVLRRISVDKTGTPSNMSTRGHRKSSHPHTPITGTKAAFLSGRIDCTCRQTLPDHTDPHIMSSRFVVCCSPSLFLDGGCNRLVVLPDTLTEISSLKYINFAHNEV